MAPLVPFGFRLWWERVGQSRTGIREPQEILSYSICLVDMCVQN